MPATLNSFGLRPVGHLYGAQARTKEVTIASGYATTLYKHQPVKMLADGTIGAAAAGDTFCGVFMGCEFTETTGARKVQAHWPASTSATDIRAYITYDPGVMYEVQANGTLTQTHVGNLLDFASSGGATVTGGSSLSGVSTAGADAATVGTAIAQLQILGFRGSPDNAPGDTYPVLIVRIAEHQLAAPVSAGV
jgi:hypothetical protein